MISLEESSATRAEDSTRVSIDKVSGCRGSQFRNEAPREVNVGNVDCLRLL